MCDVLGMRIELINEELGKILEILKTSRFPENMGYFSKILEFNAKYTQYIIIFYSKIQYKFQNVISYENLINILEGYNHSNAFFKPNDADFGKILNYLFTNYSSFQITKSEIKSIFEGIQQELNRKLWKDENEYYLFQNPFEPDIIFHSLDHKESYIMVIQIKDLILQQKESIQTINTMLIKNQLFSLLEEKNSLLSNNSEKQMEIEMLKTQLELSFSSYEEQIVDLNEKIRQLERENRILREKVSEIEKLNH